MSAKASPLTPLRTALAKTEAALIEGTKQAGSDFYSRFEAELRAVKERKAEALELGAKMTAQLEAALREVAADPEPIEDATHFTAAQLDRLIHDAVTRALHNFAAAQSRATSEPRPSWWARLFGGA